MTVGRVNAATTPMMPRVIKISARVKANFLAAKRLGSQAAKLRSALRNCERVANSGSEEQFQDAMPTRN